MSDPAVDKVVASADQAVADIGDGAVLAVGGFGLCGIPAALIDAILRKGSRDLTVISNNLGIGDEGLARLLPDHRIGRAICSYLGDNDEFARQYMSGELHLELTPQGTLAERLRAGGAGIGAFYTPTGVGTWVAEGGMPWRYAPDGTVAVQSPPKEVREFGGVEMVLEEGLPADFGIVHAQVADRQGNLRFHGSARNFNPICAQAGRITIVEAEQIVDVGEIPADDVHVPGIFVHRIYQLTPEEAAYKPLEMVATRPRPDAGNAQKEA